VTDHSALIDAIPTDLWIGGKQVPSSSGARFPVHNPAHGAVLTTVADASTADGASAALLGRDRTPRTGRNSAARLGIGHGAA
jgi:acyl-CoA reductase-like NAD-dependent aldehyde dehydrogenase